MIVTEAMAAGERFLVKLQMGRVVLLEFTVRHCTPLEKGRFRIGAEFTDVGALTDGTDRDRIFQSLRGEE